MSGSNSTSAITTHVLDTALGRPAAGVAVRLTRIDPDHPLTVDAFTDDDGRVSELGPDQVPAGTYQLRFDTAAYFAATGQECFYPEVSVTFTVTDGRHHHVPLLLSPFAYSTYRGS
ncbi:5-hydroxyisourate hydrolase [Nocardioides albertanoniae]|uniref:5-hydroxyisourate hydrolase n=1 Tax=Nocardioides albertanoniae TaxID=1175486 RepID=A0A543ADB0_9ACTN|nr:hydroxyisourate hydrolase [Nocardioides albertanoniae]TQL70565.1 5-hydroxyisourate hydrolase [Nocardioides albertanoniae]